MPIDGGRESGQVATVMLLLMGIPLFIFAMAFAVGFGGIYLQRSQYSQAANLAAEAGAETLAGMAHLSHLNPYCQSGAHAGVVGAGAGGTGGALLCADITALQTLNENLGGANLPPPKQQGESAGYMPAGASPCGGRPLSSPSFYVKFTGETRQVLFGNAAFGLGKESFPVCAAATIASVG